MRPIRTPSYEGASGSPVPAMAVVWGAGHMSAVIQSLWDLGYRPVGAVWLNVFSLDD
jgi:hypothetical protein